MWGRLRERPDSVGTRVALDGHALISARQLRRIGGGFLLVLAALQISLIVVDQFVQSPTELRSLLAVLSGISLANVGGIWLLRRIEGSRLSRLERVLKAHTRESVLMNLMAQHTDNSVLISNAEGRIEYVNAGFTKLTGWTSDEVLGRLGSDLLIGAATDKDSMLSMMDARAARRPYHLDLQLYAKDGTTRLVAVDARPLIDENDQLMGYLSLGVDLSERRAVEGRLERLAYIDPITGLPNRAKLLDGLAEALDFGREPSVIMVDLTRLWLTRNSFGHDFADEVLTSLGERLSQMFSGEDQLAYLGGDHFAGFLLDRDEGQIRAIADSIEELLRRPVAVAETEIFLPAWIGVALPQIPSGSAMDLLRDAETAASHARAQSSRQPVFFDLAMRVRLIERQRLETALRRAIYLREGLSVAYQPVVDMASGRLAGFEALARWHPPGRPSVSPTEFVPLAEETGMIVPLSSFVFSQAARQLAAWQRMWNKPDAPLFIAINLSARHLISPGFGEWIARLVKATGVNPNWIKLEITEGAIVTDADATFPILEELRRQGFRISVDDFGTGYSSLAYLHRLPIDELKIDRAFVNELSRRQDMSKIIRVIAELGEVLNLDVVAEGIETLGELETLRTITCEYGQGFLFAQPLTADMARTLVTSGPTWATWGPPPQTPFAPVVSLLREPH